MLKKLFITLTGALFAVSSYAGGNPDFVKFPTGYQSGFTNYTVFNRAGKELVARMYANDVAVDSYKAGKPAATGSVVVMEIHKPKKDSHGKAVMGSDGVYEIDKLAAVAVMERRDDWDAAYPADQRLGNWGFAIYKADGSLKENKLNCVECHTPLTEQDYLFSYQRFVDFVKGN